MNSFKVKTSRKYRIKTKSQFFKDKYGVESPVITGLVRDIDVFGDKWRNRQYVPAVLNFMLRQVMDDIYNLNGTAYYGKIQIPGANIDIGELVFKDELEPING
tara:strand:- start:760 stop:1068 length:309 start_codon:yes stop_codon:yes gene_type:complete